MKYNHVYPCPWNLRLQMHVITSLATYYCRFLVLLNLSYLNKFQCWQIPRHDYETTFLYFLQHLYFTVNLKLQIVLNINIGKPDFSIMQIPILSYEIIQS